MGQNPSMTLWKVVFIGGKKMYCGIDVAKNKSQICIMSNDKKAIAEFEIEHNIEGFRQLEQHLTKDTKIGMEPTSNYCKALYYFLKEKYDVNYVDNIQMKNFARLHSFNVKNDKVDARLIATYLAYDFKIVNPIKTDELKDLARLYCKTLKQLVRYKYMFQNQLNVIFPELEKHCHLKKTKVIATMLLKYPNPKGIADAPTEEIRNELVKGLTRGSKFTMEYTKELQMLAQNSIGIKEYPTSCFRHTIKLMLYYQDLIDQIKKDMKVCLEKTAYCPLLDEFGYNVVGLSTIVGEVGDIRRFPNHKKFVKYCGFDVSEKQSGKSMSVNCFITKKGNRHLRAIFYDRVLVHLCYKTDIASFYYRLRKTGKHPKKCMVASARKLAVRAYYDMLRCHDQKI
jgi:transposase